MNKGPALWNKAKSLIPGGNQLLSKRSEMFLPDNWPSYYQRAKGVKVWDLDGKIHTDMSIMGIGTCVLGYADDSIDHAVKAAIDMGNMSTLNCHEEVELAEKLIDLHPWSRMARFARTGAEINAAAVRIARAYTGRDIIAFCGYHGWSDWYLAANLADQANLDGQLLPGLSPAGVPRGLKGTALPFHYGNITGLETIVSEHPNQVGGIVMEVARGGTPDIEFVQAVQAIAKRIGAVLIFDEISSGFRTYSGGMHLAYDLEPDMMTLGKAMGNGYPITAVIGKREVMEAAQDTFISSCYWTERLGFVAALGTIRRFQEDSVASHLTAIDKQLREGLERLFETKGLEVDVIGMPTVPILAIKENRALEIKTIITQEMLKRGFLASNVIYVTFAHTKEIIEQYLTAMDEVLEKIRVANTLESLLEGPVSHSGFKRLT